MAVADSLNRERSRSESIVRVSVVGIIVNLMLVVFKAAVGYFTNSIAITIDAINNLTDAAASLITIVGTKLSNKRPDYKHPYGYGRLEYITTIVVGLIITSAGINSLGESVSQIRNPETPSYTVVALAIIAVGVVVKILLGIYFRKAGNTLESDSLVASGTDALSDSFISLSTLVAAIIFIMSGQNLEPWLGLIIAALIIKAGIEILHGALAEILGERVDDDLAINIKNTAASVEGVHGAYDLAINDYGPQRLYGSIHIEVDDLITAHEVDRIAREVQSKVFDAHHVVLHTVGIYCTNTDDTTMVERIRRELEHIRKERPNLLEVHGLYVDEEEKHVSFDAVISFNAKDPNKERDEVVREVSKVFPGYTFSAVVDSDVSAIAEKAGHGGEN